MAIIAIKPLDGIMKRYAKDLRSLGDTRKTYKVIARAANYEGRKAFTQVKRALRKQTSIPSAVVQRSVKFFPASTSVGRMEVAIHGSGRELSLKLFRARQFKAGVRAHVWGKSKMYKGGFMGPRPGVIAPKLAGHAFVRAGKSRLPISKMFGPSIAKEIVKDESAQAFYASAPRIIERVGKEIAAVMRGY